MKKLRLIHSSTQKGMHSPISPESTPYHSLFRGKGCIPLDLTFEQEDYLLEESLEKWREKNRNQERITGGW